MKLFKELSIKRKRLKEERADRVLQQSRLMSLYYQGCALNPQSSGVTSNSPRPIVVSLTSFDKRIHDVYLTIESLFQQSRKVDKVVLWLSRDSLSPNDIPAILQSQVERGLDIEFCDKDLGPLTKIYYSLKQYPDSLILTVDDDILYPLDMVDLLYRAHIKQPDVIHCHRAHDMRKDDKGALMPYKQWQWNARPPEPSRSLFPTGVGGVLYFPNCFDNEVFNQDAYLRLSPTADDVWLKAMSLKKGTLCRAVDDGRDWGLRFGVIEGSQKYSLKRKNKQKNMGNDSQIKAVFDAYNLTALL